MSISKSVRKWGLNSSHNNRERLRYQLYQIFHLFIIFYRLMDMTIDLANFSLSKVNQENLYTQVRASLLEGKTTYSTLCY